MEWHWTRVWSFHAYHFEAGGCAVDPHGRLHESHEWLRALCDDAGVPATGVHERASINLSHTRRDGKIKRATWNVGIPMPLMLDLSGSCCLC